VRRRQTLIDEDLCESKSSGSCDGIRVSRGTRPREAARKRGVRVVPEHWNTDDDQGTNERQLSRKEASSRKCDRLQKSRPPIFDRLSRFDGAATPTALVREQKPLTLRRVSQESPREPLHPLVVGLGFRTIVRVRTRAACMD
jgi:hypothetical protein